MGVAQQDRIIPAAAMFEDVDQPADQPGGAAGVVNLDGPFEAVAICEAPRREGRRQPCQQP